MQFGLDCLLPKRTITASTESSRYYSNKEVAVYYTLIIIFCLDHTAAMPLYKQIDNVVIRLETDLKTSPEPVLQ